MNKHLYTWHRRLGALLALIVIILCLSGIALNHTDQLHLDRLHVRSSLILGWYDIAAPGEASTINLGQDRITLLADHLYGNGILIGAPYSELVGAVSDGDLIAVAAEASILLLTPGFELVESMGPAQGVPAGIQALGSDGTHLYARTPDGLWQADQELLAWTRANPDSLVKWSEVGKVSADSVDEVRQDYLGRILTWERVVLDLHSGRLLGVAGPWLADIVALMLLGLAASGLWMWSRRLR
jgi:hypothetical protein